MIKYRKFITLALGFAFLIVGVTGVFFKFFFKNHAMTEIHVWLGLAMVVAATLHISQNIRPISSYLKNPRVLTLQTMRLQKFLKLK